jgi:hypothetical protein
MKAQRVLCINNGKVTTDDGGSGKVDHRLTMGKWYDALIQPQSFGPDWYILINDQGCRRNYLCLRFITIEEFRNQQLQELLQLPEK